MLFIPTMLTIGNIVIIHRGNWTHLYFIVVGEIIGFMRNKLFARPFAVVLISYSRLDVPWGPNQ